MANSGDMFRDALIAEIQSWGDPIDILSEKPVGARFVKTPRYLDIILKYTTENESKYLGIEAKVQNTDGTAYQKLTYALEDCKVCPIPTIIVFSGKGIRDDMKSQLITSGFGIEVEYDAANGTIIDNHNLFRQRVYIELGLDWFSLY